MVDSGAVLYGPDGGVEGWVHDGDKCHMRMKFQQVGGGVMILAGIVADEIAGPFRGLEEIKLMTLCNVLSVFPICSGRKAGTFVVITPEPGHIHAGVHCTITCWKRHKRILKITWVCTRNVNGLFAFELFRPYSRWQ